MDKVAVGGSYPLKMHLIYVDERLLLEALDPFPKRRGVYINVHIPPPQEGIP